MLKALIVNDDGYKAAGIRALVRELNPHYHTVAVAPDREQSWMGKSISGHHELALTPISYHEFEGFHVNGTPADCTQLGLYETGKRPDFVVSGINHGANIGHAHIISSGTVGAAFEAALQGVPAFAVSVWQVKRLNPDMDFNAPASIELFKTAATVTRRVIDKVMAAGFPKSVQVIVINVAYDVTPDAKWAVTTPHTLSYGKLFDLQSNGMYKNLGSNELEVDKAPDTDLAALAKGYVSVVPLTLRLTSDAGRAELAEVLDAPIFSTM